MSSPASLYSQLKGHVTEYPTMYYSRIPRRTQSMIEYMIWTDYLFLEIPVKNCILGMLLTLPIDKTLSFTLQLYQVRK